MDDGSLPPWPRPTAEQYRERANLARQKAAAMKSRLCRQDLLDIARQYEELADIAARAILG